MKTEEKTTVALPKVKLSSLRANVARENGGDWVELPDYPGAAVNVRSFNYPPYVVARDLLNRRLMKKYKGDISEARDVESAREFGKLYASYILLGWRGFDDEYSPEVALERLPDPEWRPLKEAVGWAAMQIAEGNVEFVETASKNSAKPSATA